MKTSVTWVDIPTNFLFYNYCVDKDVNNDTEESCCGVIINREVPLIFWLGVGGVYFKIFLNT